MAKTTKDSTHNPELVDNLVLRSGKSGKLLAWHLARLGQRTATVERRWIRGSCPNVACLPTKNEIWSGRVAHFVHHASEFGTATGTVTTDMEGVRRRKRAMVDREIAAHLENFKTSGAELIMGDGRFTAPLTTEVRLNDGGTRLLRAHHVFLNIGTHARIPEIAGLESARPLTHTEILELDYAPPHLVVLGGGYVGLEMAQPYRRFCSRVTIIETGIEILSAAEPRTVAGRSGEGVCVNVHTASREQRIEGSDMVATGRVPNTHGLGFEEVGMALHSHGYIRVNDRLETTAPDVWAMGECCGSPQFTHVAADDYRMVRDNLAGGMRTTRDRVVPYCMFTDPPLAHVGMSERQAQRDRVPVRGAKLPVSAVLRTEATDETQAFMKAVIGGDDDRILCFTMIGAEAEVMATVQTEMMAGLPYPTMRDAILAHPTIAEGFGLLVENVPPRSASKNRHHVVAAAAPPTQ